LCQALLGDASFHRQLLAIDEELAAEAQPRGCSACGGRLQRADYPRKPRGVPDGLGVDFERRRSFCCGREGCRRRLTPPSVRFLGRRVWLSVVVTLSCVATQGVSPGRARKLREELGVERRTLERWRRWWVEIVPHTRWWREVRGGFVGDIVTDLLPRSLLDRLVGDVRARVTGLLRLMLPLSHSERMARRYLMAR